MAVKITSDAIVKVIQPSLRKFNIDELNDNVEGWIEPIKIGPIWVMYREKSKESGEPLNKVASFFFDVAMYGTVLVVPPQQMPDEWDLMEDSDLKYTADQVETGFLSALQSALAYNRVYNAPGTLDNSGFVKEEWTYTPTGIIDDNIKDFFKKAHQYLVTHEIQNDSNVIFEDDMTIVRIKSNADKDLMLQQMIDILLETEEYEKCAELQKIKDSIEL